MEGRVEDDQPKHIRYPKGGHWHGKHWWVEYPDAASWIDGWRVRCCAWQKLNEWLSGEQTSTILLIDSVRFHTKHFYGPWGDRKCPLDKTGVCLVQVFVKAGWTVNLKSTYSPWKCTYLNHLSDIWTALGTQLTVNWSCLVACSNSWTNLSTL